MQDFCVDKTMAHSILFFALFFCASLQAQTDCGNKKPEPLPGAIFGPDLLLIFGADTIVTKTKEQIIYSCEQCCISCRDSSGKVKWIKDLTKFKCRVISFGEFNRQKDLKVKGCSIYIQFKDQSAYGLNARNGKIRSLKRLLEQKNRKREKVRNYYRAFKK